MSSADEGGGETLLVVEDDNGVRELTTTILRGHGYRVIAAANGQEAGAVAKAKTDPQ